MNFDVRLERQIALHSRIYGTKIIGNPNKKSSIYDPVEIINRIWPII